MIILTPQKTINKAYLKLPVIEAQIDTMRKNFDTLKANAVEGESEENYKNLIANFLRDTWYTDYQINTSERIDLAIYNSSEAVKGKPAVLIEVKAPQNKGEMCTLEDMNKKAFHESVLYFLREREQNHNNEIKYILITNYNEYFLINAKNFLDNIASDSRVKEIYKKHTSGQLTNDKTSTFYEEIKALNLPANERLEITHFSLQDFENAFAQNDEQTLIALYKLLSPETLLAKPFANDSNSLDTKFYAELLHIIGLEEVSEGGQKIIKRLPQGKRQYASLFEGAMYQLEDKINSEEERAEVAMRLVITWVNRLLFLKLLEAQQLAYQSGDKSYRFLDIGFIRDFDDLNELFFKVLARRTAERHESIADKYSKVPYLNSSLFERTEDEQKFLEISNLKTAELAIFNATVLKEHDGGRRIGKLDTLTYIFEFLDAYNFASDGNSAIQQDKKTLINASVLGLIFEKINGYKDGSFFTPGFITQYMAHEAIERAVVRKFNEAKGWKCQSLIDVKNEIEDRVEAAEIFDTLKICDPAVGSGHFLVSILNELIATKFYLGLLFSPDGFRVNPVEWQITVENDELSIVNENGSIYAYNPKNQNTRFVQEALFNEKRNLIENCLFGADINPNSVNICRLRLWIELLKNAYYTRESGYKELETLPNIDINIKCGNSLISKYPVNDAQGLRGIKKQLVAEYKIKVAEYKSEKDKSTKGEITEIISRIKEQFTEAFQLSLFDQEQNQNRLNNSIYKNGIEWVMEFPEVLDENGRFMGFDVVIGNPPYIVVPKNGIYAKQFKTNDCLELYAYFFERAIQMLQNNGIIAFITASLYIKGLKFESLRNFLETNTELINLKLTGDNVFHGVKMPSAVFIGLKQAGQWKFKDLIPGGNICYKMEQVGLSLDEISEIQRGFEIGRNDVENSGDYPFLTGSNVQKYTHIKLSYISKQTYNDFAKDDYFYNGERLLLRETGSLLTVLYEKDLLYCNRSLYSIKITKEDFSTKYVLAVLNSKAIQYYYSVKFKSETYLFPKIRIKQARLLPIPSASPSQQLPIITLVDKILAAKQSNPHADTSELEKQIDKAVYELYGLTEEEIGIIEK